MTWRTYTAASAAANWCYQVRGLNGNSLGKPESASQHVTAAFGVPTMFGGAIAALEKSRLKLPSLTRTIVGGAPMPAFDVYGVPR